MKAFLATIGFLAALAAAGLPARADEYSFKRTLDTTAPLGGATAVGISGFNGNIHVFADGSGTAVRVHAVLGARDAEGLKGLDVQVAREGSTLRVAEVCPSERRLLFWTFRDCDIELDVHYPRALPLSVHSENGNIVLDGARGAVSVANGNGNIHVSGAGAAVSVKNANGNVTIEGAPANVSVFNTNGNVIATLADGWHGSAIALRTNAGNVELTVPKDFKATVTAQTRLGDVKTRAQIAKGPATVTATTTFGNVVIDSK